MGMQHDSRGGGHSSPPGLREVVGKVSGLGALALALLGTARAASWILLRLPELKLAILHARDSWAPMRRAIGLLERSEGVRLYDVLFFQEKTKFQYPPTSLLHLEFLGLLFTTSSLALNVFNATAFVANAVFLAVLAYVLFAKEAPAFLGPPPLQAHFPWIAAGLAFAAGLVFYPAIKSLLLGQIQVWIDLALTLSILLWCRQSRFAAGLLVGFASTIKPQYGLFLVWGLLWRQGDFVVGFLSILVPIGLVALWRFGLHNHIEYLQVLSYISQHGETFAGNNSINGIVNRLLMNGQVLYFDPNAFAPYNVYVHLATTGALIAFIAVALAPGLVGGRNGTGPLQFGIAALCFTMASPVAWDHHYGVMPALYIVALHGALSAATEQPRRRQIVMMLCLSWFLSAGHWPVLPGYDGPPWNITFAHLFFGAVALLAALVTLTKATPEHALCAKAATTP